ncbi:hypothetical protein DL769_007310 [Monosporascus sp. CRB-8-3]|nr:hypothetical protein DL769_007310 [Monosporascus sp. CRB-8-3]
MSGLFGNAAILGQWVWSVFVAVAIIITPAVFRSVSHRQVSTKKERPERHLTLRIDEVPSDTSREVLENDLRSIAKRDSGLQDAINALSQLTLVRRNKHIACATASFRTSIPEDELIERLRRASEGQPYKYDCKFYGITPLYEDETSAQVDIITVPGLASHAIGSWKSPSSSDIWLRDYLPVDLPNALVHARKKSTDKANLEVSNACCGLLFFGVPNLGLRNEQLQSIVEGQPNQNLIRDLVVDSDSEPSTFLKRISNDFSDCCKGQYRVVSFYETELSPTVLMQPNGQLSKTGPKILMVTERSATSTGLTAVPDEDNIGFDTDHSGLVKYDSRSQGMYPIVRERLETLISEDVPRITKRFQDTPGALKKSENPSHKPHWMVPFERNEDFVGRELLLQQLLEKITPRADQDHCRRTAIVGLGGVGKTQIALEAVYRIHETDPECSIFWVPAVDTTSFERAYRDIGRELQIDGIKEDNADVKSLVKAALRHEGAGRWLFVVDNADDLELLYGKTAADVSDPGPALARYVPFSPKGSILFTTRNDIAAKRLAGKNPIRVGSMDTDEARKLLETNLDARLMSDHESTTLLLDQLANLPLAIMQASAYMNETEKTTAEYLKMYQSNHEEMIYLLSREFEDLGRYDNIKNPIATTWLISFRQILHSNLLAADYLRFMCFLAEQDIPQSLLPSKGEARTADAIATLKAYSFITEREHSGSYDIHRLVQVSARYWLKVRGEWNKWATNALQQLAEAFPFPEHNNRDVWVRYLPHAQFVLAFRDDADDEKAEGDLLFKVGESNHILGKYQEAEYMHRQALKLRKTVLGEKHPDTLASMNNLAAVLRREAKYEMAEQIHRQTLELRKTVLGEKHPETLDSMNNLALVFGDQGNYEEAGQMLRQTVELRELALGTKHPDTLWSMNNLANVRNSEGKYEEAEQMHRQTLELKEKALGGDHPDTLASMNNLAVTLDNQGKDQEAERMHRQTLELKEKVLGREHPDTLASMNNLALVLRKLGRLEESEKMQRKEWNLTEKVLGKEHPNTLASMNNLANLLLRQGKYEEAEQMHRKTLKLREKELGKKHPETLTSMNNLARTLNRQRKYEEAEQIHRRTLELKEKVLSKDHPDTLASMNNLATVLDSRGKYEEAEQIYRQTLGLRQRVLGKDHPDTLDSMNNVVAVLDSQGKHEAAEQMHRQRRSKLR